MSDHTIDDATLTTILDERDHIALDGAHAIPLLRRLQFALYQTEIVVPMAGEGDERVEDVLVRTYRDIAAQAETIQHVAARMAAVQERIRRAR